MRFRRHMPPLSTWGIAWKARPPELNRRQAVRWAAYCLGAALGKLEARLALEALTSRFPDLRLVEGQELSFHPNISFRGPQSLWVRATQGP